MNPSARVASVEALVELKAALSRFREQAQAALAAADVEVRRSVDSLRDQLVRWQNEVRVQQEELTRAKGFLIQRKWGSQDGKGPGTTEAELAVKAAQQRLRYAEEKIDAVRRWQRMLPQAVEEYEGPSRVLAGSLDTDVRRSIALLEAHIATLEAYLGLTAPSSEPRPLETPTPPASEETP